MLSIGKSCIVHEDGKAKLCAEASIGNRAVTLWYAVDRAQESCLALGRADPFVMALLPGAMRGGHEVVCEDPMSERLHDQLVNGLIPSLVSAGELYHSIKITAPLTAEGLPNQGAVGTGFSGGADCLYTIMRHGKDSEFPLTHIAVFSNGVFDGPDAEEQFRANCSRASQFAIEQGLKTVFVDTNFNKALPERFLDVYSFRNLSCAMALEQLFSVYLLSSGHDAAHFGLDIRNSSSFDLMTARYASTESLTFYHSGEEARRLEKLSALSDWPPSWQWLHPCFRRGPDQPNCGHCKKCVRDMTTFYALGKLERYEAVYDIPDYFRNLPQRIGVLLAHGDGHLYDETIQLLKARGIPIPQSAFAYERQFRQAMRRLKAEKSGECVSC